MKIDLINGHGLLYMKVGIHARESLEDIILRKQKEYDEAGMIFWGYGGNTCHPTKHVQPFAKEFSQKGKEIVLVMQEINSNHFAEPKAAEAYSDDGFAWKPIPRGIEVRGSRYALILDELELQEFDINMRDLNVAAGPSRGTVAAEYIQGRVDKGCFELNLGHTPEKKSDLCRISLCAKLIEPYAVHLR